MVRIEKKTWPKFFEKVRSGEKRFELRLADWECKPGDTLVLREWNPKTGEYTGRVLEKKVTYIVKTKELKFFSQEEVEKYGWQVMSLK